MTTEQLKAIQERAATADEGWRKIHRMATRQEGASSYMRIPADPQRDADLILGAFFREDVPALLEHIEGLERGKGELAWLMSNSGRCSFCEKVMLQEESAKHMHECEKHPMAAALKRVRELEEALRGLLRAYESQMRSEYDFPGDPWTPKRDNDTECLAARRALSTERMPNDG